MITGQRREAFVGLHSLEQLEPLHVRQLEIEHHAVEWALLEFCQSLLARCDRRHLHVLAVAEKLDDRLSLGRLVVDDEQVLDAALEKGGDLLERIVQAALVNRFLEEGDGACAQRVVLAVLGACYDMDRNVPRVRVALEVVEDSPAVHHRQLHVENDCVGLVLMRERQADVAAQGDDAFEAALARDLEHRSSRTSRRPRRSARSGRRCRSFRGHRRPRSEGSRAKDRG
jgi:hypothetical protein